MRHVPERPGRQQVNSHTVQLHHFPGPLEDGHITEDDFHDFVFANAVRLWGTQNPRFFEGTAVAKEAAALLKNGAPTLHDAAK